jgi:hypothetical protein
MRLSVEMELRDVYGGDGCTRIEPTTRTTLKRRKKTATTKDFIGATVEDGLDQEMSETKLEPIATFRMDEQKRPTLRLGGAHGKLWGALKGCAKQLKDLGDSDFNRYSTLMDMVFVSPAWVPLETSGEAMKTEKIPQLMAGMTRSMVVQSFDVVGKALVKVDITFPDVVDAKVRKLLAQLETGTHLNKRRSVIRILNITEVKN